MVSWPKYLNGMLPVVVDLETSGVDHDVHALLEIACIFLDKNRELSLSDDVFHEHVKPFHGSVQDPDAMALNKIPVDHPFRFDKDEHDVLSSLSKFIGKKLKESGCQRCILVGHNAHFDLGFLNKAYQRTGIKSPFHRFCVLDTVTLSATMLGETVLAKALMKSKIGFDPSQAHSALYDAKQTAKLFCHLANQVLTD